MSYLETLYNDEKNFHAVETTGKLKNILVELIFQKRFFQHFWYDKFLFFSTLGYSWEHSCTPGRQGPWRYTSNDAGNSLKVGGSVRGEADQAVERGRRQQKVSEPVFRGEAVVRRQQAQPGGRNQCCVQQGCAGTTGIIFFFCLNKLFMN